MLFFKVPITTYSSYIKGKDSMKLTHSRIIKGFLLVLSLIISSTIYANSEFPGRAKYPTTPYISLTDLHKTLDKSIVVDVRSSYEYKTLRIKGSLNVPLASKDYVDQMRFLRKEHPDKKIVVYCNGKSCMKSYKAALKCKRNNIKDVVSYDAGIMDWATKYPANAVLLDESPIDPKKIISKKTFKTYLISPDEFEKKIGSGKSIVLDVRDRFQRDAAGLFHGKEKRVFIDDASQLDKYIFKANKQNKTLLIYDEVGKQVRWLQYYLEGKNLKSYFFMKGGVKGYYKYLDEKYSN